MNVLREKSLHGRALRQFLFGFDLNGTADFRDVFRVLSSTLSNSCGLGKRILHAIPDLAWNFYAISVRPGHERNLMTPDFAAYSSDRITEGEDRFWVPSSGPGLEFSGFGEIMCPERYN